MVYKSKKIGKEEGKILVKLARDSVKSFFKKEDLKIDEKSLPNILKEERGVFVTIKIWPNKELRGCIGYIFPVKPLYKGVIDVSREAAFNDPRFNPLLEEELEKVIFEVTVLTELRKIDYKSPEDLLRKIKVGRDGIYLKYGFYSGVLLPQVPIEEKWDEEEFISYSCLKAGLPYDFWKRHKLEVYTFSGQIFEEEEPNSEDIKEIDLY